MPDVVSLDPRASGAPPWQTLAAEADRRRLTAPALKALVRLMAAWRVTNEQAAALLGVSPRNWDRLRYGRGNQTPSQDPVKPAPALIGTLSTEELRVGIECGRTFSHRGPA